jgi:hypothetical protein
VKQKALKHTHIERFFTGTHSQVIAEISSQFIYVPDMGGTRGSYLRMRHDRA